MCVECKRNAKCSGYNEDGVTVILQLATLLRVLDAAHAVKFFRSVADFTRINSSSQKQSYYGLDVVVVVVVWLGELPLLQVVVF